MIADLLPRYYEHFEDNLRYEAISSVVILGHEVAWMSYTGTVRHDITGQGQEGNTFTGRTLMCECNFTQFVGWEVKDGRRYTKRDPGICQKRAVALEQRHAELRKEYETKFGVGPGGLKTEHVPEMVLDLIKKQTEGEWLEDSAGAQFWGGHFYAQTVESIAGFAEGEAIHAIYEMESRQQITLEGMVVQTYVAPPPEKWEECFKVEMEGWQGTAFLPAHSRMKQEWRFEVINPEGQQIPVEDANVLLGHTPIFGPDVDDVDTAQHKLLELIDQARASA